MGEVSGIQWTHSTFNPWLGCSRVSPGCDNCYAEVGSRRLGAQHGLKLWDGDHFMTGVSYWRKPRLWNQRAAQSGEPHRVFCGSFCDVFEDHPDVTDTRIGLGALIRETPLLTWMLLTKRPENIERLSKQMGFPGRWPLNVWLGVTIENNAMAAGRLEPLLAARVATVFASFEPLLEPIVFEGHLRSIASGLNWAIIGGESGRHARPFPVASLGSFLAFCRRYDVAPFVKQLGSVWAKATGAKDSHGGDWSEWPAELRVREFPEAA